MKACLKLFFVILFVITANISYAQYILLKDATGGDIVPSNGYVDIEGSPYLNQDWMPGTLTLKSGKIIKGINLKYDEVKDQVYVKGPNNELVLINDKVNTFVFDDNLHSFKNGFLNIPGFTGDAYFEVLADGKTQLLKKEMKIIQTDKPYNSATTTKIFVATPHLYLVSAGGAMLMKKDKKSVLTAFNAKQVELDAFIKANNLNLKDEADIAKLVDYYNTLN